MAVSCALVVLIWLMFAIQALGFFQQCYGVIPLTVTGLRGILLSPLMHDDFNHILSNTAPLFFSSFLLFQFYPRIAPYILVIGWVLSGTLLWTIGNLGINHPLISACHIGASSIIYLLLSFLFFSGLLRRDISSISVAVVVFFLYRGLAYFVIPLQFVSGNMPSNMSWQAHLSGVLIGLLLAYLFRRIARTPKTQTQML